ncbi:MAG: N-6 DNA methylase, partial [Nanoarchaeota archaeon]
MDEEQAKEKLKELIKKFPAHADHNEENLQFNYIEPLLIEVLGWKREDIVKEQRVLKGRADYILKIGNEEVLVIETKRPSVKLTEDEGRQAVSYAYHRKIKFAVLTNFKEVKVYHALSNIRHIDNNLLKFESGGLFRLPIEQFIENFDKLLLLSRESFEKQEINKLLSKRDEKLFKAIDQSILLDLLQIREWLSKDIKKLRTYLKEEQIDEVVQILIDRLIFMRSVEDRGLEDKDFLLNIVKDYEQGRTTKRIWETLKIKFKIFDKEYNSKLFAQGLLEDEKNVFFDDSTLKKVIGALYFGTQDQQERYMFDEIPGDLLGNIYEQYLGTILSGTEKRVKLETGTGKRKKMGIYYTPSYIVDYIVKNTVREYIKDKAIDEILEVKILDPACGSGSFLTRAFQEVCDVVEGKLKKGGRGKTLSFNYYNGRISLAQKAMILSSCIYGVDLDEKAVELAQLNLLLKMLENEGRDIPNKRLPNLLGNIKNGNSLIDDPKVA